MPPKKIRIGKVTPGAKKNALRRRKLREAKRQQELQYEMDRHNTPQQEIPKVVEDSKMAETPATSKDEDDDVVIMEEADIEKAEVTVTLADITKAIAMGKQVAQLSEEELVLIKKEIVTLETYPLEDGVYDMVTCMMANPKALLNIPMSEKALENMITNIFESIPPEERFDPTDREFSSMALKLDVIEKSNQAVSKIFLECHTKLKQLKQELTKELADVEAEIALYEKQNEETCLLIDSDEESDLTILNSSFPSSDSKKSPQKEPAAQAAGTNAEKQQHQDLSSMETTVSESHPNIKNILGSPANKTIPSIDELRSKFVNAVNKSIPSLITTLQHQSSTASTTSTQNSTLTTTARQQATQQQTQPQVANKTLSLQLPVKWPELKVHDKVLGKKFNDVWYSGTILDIYPASVNTEWSCKVKFDGKGLKVLPGKHVAYRDSIAYFIKVGTRVVAVYKEEDAANSFYAGVIAEAPSAKNNRRFLVFFDDGYAQYCDAKELHKVYMQSENVWEDINPDTSAFIKEYLRIYPERPMVRLSKGQVVRTEWNGKWWTAKVQETDASLVKMYFQADKRTEWIYRGSTRLEPLFKALANADAIKAAGSSRGRRHNLNMRPSDTHTKPSVEYTRGVVDDDSNSSPASSQKDKAKATAPVSRTAESSKKKSNVAKKSTGGIVPTVGTSSPSPELSDTSKSIQWEAPWTKYQRKAPATQRSQSVDSTSQDSDKVSTTREKTKPSSGNSQKFKDIATVLAERLAASSTPQVEYDEEQATGKRVEKSFEINDQTHVTFKAHKCGPSCVDERVGLEKFKGHSSLQIPIMLGWERQVCKARPSTKRFIVYRAPCGLRLRTIEEVDKYLYTTDSQLSIDLFCFDQELHVNTEFVAVKTYCDIKDLSYGRENYPVSCVNGVDRHYPDYVEYSDHRIPSKGVTLNLDPEFLTCCDCTDNCRDRSKCACQQMTIENTSWIGEKDENAGYHYRRLPEPLFTGIVECNSRCKCDSRCANKVAQNGLKMRLQVFKTEKKGWGLRCLDDIAKGSFICIYAGQLLTDKGANEDGKQFGDEYLAELDFIEVVERQKEGYESDADLDFSDDDKDDNYKAEDDSDYTEDSPPRSRRKLRKRKADDSESETKKDKTESPEQVPEPTTVDKPISISDDEEEEDDEDPNPKKVTEPSGPLSPEVTKKLRSRAKKSTGGSRFNLSTSFKTTQEALPEKDIKKERAPTRSYFLDDTECYIMDAKLMGNLGRYLNHSCSPNVFVQNIFVDTHDLRFPWVAFFAGQYIRAGTELTWDYNYEVGSVPDKILYCYCGSATCRGRLL
ncbi:histone-lysine N-methyltransferase SETDB1-like isoform X2 [Biomphalaria glabrata]|nr:histone-lysine N-methyltransferase SETDB1-like isoform X2 [Biomphalaria glabrata]XP_055899560.1 histone-lysine N-methyltransferase SETDB1-like isoform X2 [Biomphalaria glabrata]XP_055899562.1 histone-lysine N-methyltransferase SETDB1-like isoform X2 [Biomphalaria glabrata]